jgi:hypothetical protein
MEQVGPENGPKAIAEWESLRARLKTLGGSTTAVSLVNLRQVRPSVVGILARARARSRPPLFRRPPQCPE